MFKKSKHGGATAQLARGTRTVAVVSMLLSLLGSAGAQTSIRSTSKFPIKITKSGSYVLKSNLTPPLNTDAIDVQTNNVTVDLNGFSISGNPTLPNVWAISASASSGVIVRNGQVTGLCFSLGQNALVEDVIALNCSLTDSIDVGANSGVFRSVAIHAHNSGIVCNDIGPIVGSNCLFADNTANSNSLHGIGCTHDGCNFSRNTANGNGIGVGNGLDCNGTVCLFNGNVSNGNAGAGIAALDKTSAISQNVLNGNTATPFGGATSLGNNLCNGSPC